MRQIYYESRRNHALTSTVCVRVDIIHQSAPEISGSDANHIGTN